MKVVLNPGNKVSEFVDKARESFSKLIEETVRKGNEPKTSTGCLDKTKR